jgi:heptosyltransferase-1
VSASGFQTPPRSVLIVRLSAIGDAVFCSVLAGALKAAWPGTRIDWLGEAMLSGLLEGHPAVSTFIPWDRAGMLAELRRGRLDRVVRAMAALRRRLRAADYDLVIDAQGLAKSRVLSWLAGGRELIGLPSAEGLDFLVHRVVPREGRPGAFAREYAALAERLTGTPARPPVPREAPGGPAYRVLLPFTTRPQKAWPERYWTELAGRLCADGPGPVRVLGGPGDRQAAERIFAGTGVDNRVGRTGLGEALGLVRGAAGVIGVDTGLTHAAVLAGRPCVVLVGASVPYTQGPEGCPTAVLHEPLACSPCGRAPSCAGRFDCMVALTPDRVVHALGRVTAPARDT